DARHAVLEVVRRVASALRNTPAICRRCYVHPAVVEAFESGTTLPRSLADGSTEAVERTVIRLLQTGRRRSARRAPADVRRRSRLPRVAAAAALDGARELSA